MIHILTCLAGLAEEDPGESRVGGGTVTVTVLTCPTVEKGSIAYCMSTVVAV